jgi:hypothetical protein
VQVRFGHQPELPDLDLILIIAGNPLGLGYLLPWQKKNLYCSWL